VKVSGKLNIMVVGDVLLALFAVYAGYSLRFISALDAEGTTHVKALQLPFFVIGVVFSSFLVELYNSEKVMSTRERVARIAISLALSFTLLSALYYAMPDISLGRGSFALSLGAFSLSQLLWHTLYSAFLNADGLAKKVLVLGTGNMAQQIGSLIRDTNHQHVLRGYFGCAHEIVTVSPLEIVGEGSGLIDAVRREKAQKIVVSLSERRGALPVSDILACKLSGVEIVDAPSFYEELTGKLLLEDLRPSWLIFSDGFRITPTTRMLKRIFDVVLAAIALCIVLPILPVIVLLIKVDSAGPVLFKQKRVGERERPFVLIKFRTMKKDAEDQTGPVWAQKNDQRVTRVGQFLRKVRLDELPQFLNVLKGDMSLIGPRPERPEFVAKLKEIIPFYSERHFVKPGITGWAQIKYPYGASVEDAIEKLKFDLFYIKNMSQLLDLLIFLETIKVVLFGRGGR